MAQLFPRSADMWLRLVLLLLFLGLVGGFVAFVILSRSSYVTGVGLTVDQPVPFSHEHHAGALQIDCRYCHDNVETSAVAGLPPTHTCMSCHSQLDHHRASALTASHIELVIAMEAEAI